VKDRTARLLKRSTAALKIDKGLELTRRAKCKCRLEGSSKSHLGGFLKKGQSSSFKALAEQLPGLPLLSSFQCDYLFLG
jgi:hypothetical protein